MSEEELSKVFEWLEENMNKNDLLYFKFVDDDVIGAYFKSNNQHFADFYISIILKIIKGGKDE